MDQTIKTPQTHPTHETVGSYFQGWSGAIYYCDSYDPRIGFWMTSVRDSADRRNVSERAIGRTFHEMHGHVRAHQKHRAEHEYYSVDILQPGQEVQPFDSTKAAMHRDPDVLVFFGQHYARAFLRSLRKAFATSTEPAQA